MNEAFVELNGVRTKVVTYGRWIEESKGNTDDIILIIPGNPGVTGFYKTFAKTLYEKTEIPVWCLGHAGHNFAEHSVALPKFDLHKDLYNVKGQVEHKIDFFRKYVPENAKVHLIAHSFGSYISVEILEHPDVKNKVEDVYLLFPTVEYMAETKNGQFLINWIKPIVWLAVCLCWVYTLLPKFFATFLLYIYMFIANVPRDLHTENIHDLLKPGILKRVFYLAYDEMDLIKERNNAVIERNINKIRFYYGRTDGWAPEAYYDKLKGDIPDADALLTDINHEFVFRNSEEVAGIVANWIKAKK